MVLCLVQVSIAHENSTGVACDNNMSAAVNQTMNDAALVALFRMMARLPSPKIFF
jgi:hypothetical protein